MSSTQSITAAQLARMPDDGNRYELVAGALRMMSPSGWKHGEITLRISGLLWRHVESRRLGKLFGAETGFLISRDPDTVRAPDVAFVARENLPKVDPDEAYWPGAPDLAIEVLSPNDSAGAVEVKIRSWLDSGCAMVWVVAPEPRTVTVYRAGTDARIRLAGQTLDGSEIVRGFTCRVDEIFGDS